jgi:transposase
MRYPNKKPIHVPQDRRDHALRLIDSGVALPDVARRFKVSLTTLYKWRKQTQIQPPKILTITPDKASSNKLTLSMGEFLVEVSRIDGGSH